MSVPYSPRACEAVAQYAIHLATTVETPATSIRLQ